MAAFSLGQPGGSGRPSRHKGVEAGLHECGVSIRWLALGANSSLEHVQQGGMVICQACIRGLRSLRRTFRPASSLLSLTFSIQYPPGDPAKRRTPAQNVCYPLPWWGCMSSKLDFCGVDREFGPERAGCVGTYSKKPGLANVLSWGSWIFRAHKHAWASELKLSTYAAMGVAHGWNDCG